MNPRYFEIVNELADKSLSYLKDVCKRHEVPCRPAVRRSLINRIALACAPSPGHPSEDELLKVVDLAIDNARRYQAAVKMVPAACPPKAIDFNGARGWVARKVLEAQATMIGKSIGKRAKSVPLREKRA